MEKAIQKSHGARPVNQVIQSMWRTRTSRLSIKNSLSTDLSRGVATEDLELQEPHHLVQGYLAHKKTPTPLETPWDPRHRPRVGS